MASNNILACVFAKLGRERELLEFSEILFKLMGLVMDFISAEGMSLRLSKGRNFCPFCQAIRSTAAGESLCRACELKHSAEAQQRKEQLVYQCHAGLVDIAVPLFDANGEYLGSLSSGQFRINDGGGEPSDETRERLRFVAEQVGRPYRELFDLYLQSRELTTVQVDGLLQYLRTVGSLIVTTHHNLMFMELQDAPDKVSLAKEYIKKHYNAPLSLKVVARHLAIAPEYFCTLFRKTSGVGFNSYLNYYRVQKAKEFLQDSKLYVSQIAQLTGFGSTTQFHRVFRKAVGCSPQEWRRQNQA